MESDPQETHLDYEILNRFADGAQPEGSAAAVTSHLRACETCRKEVQFIRALSAAIRAFPTPKPPVELPEELLPEEPSTAAVGPSAAPTGKLLAFSRARLPTSGGCMLAPVAAGVMLLVRPIQVVAESSTRSL